MRTFRTCIASIFGLLLVGAMAIGGGPVIAQDATPVADAHPVHIHQGTCDNLDPAPLHVLNDITPPETVAEGATIVEEPTTSDYGEEYWSDRSYRSTDLEGHTWWFVQRMREQKPRAAR